MGAKRGKADFRGLFAIVVGIVVNYPPAPSLSLYIYELQGHSPNQVMKTITHMNGQINP